jgi:hypothetical protein
MDKCHLLKQTLDFFVGKVKKHRLLKNLIGIGETQKCKLIGICCCNTLVERVKLFRFSNEPPQWMCDEWKPEMWYSHIMLHERFHHVEDFCIFNGTHLQCGFAPYQKKKNHSGIPMNRNVGKEAFYCKSWKAK